MNALRRAVVLAAGSACAVGCSAQLRAGLREGDADQVIVALDRAAIGSRKLNEPGTRDRFAIEVAAGDVTRALRVLEAEHVPRAEPAGFEALYGEPAVIPTPADARARWAAATAGELARSLQRLPGVIDARVHLAMPEATGRLDDVRSPVAASVLIQRRRDAPAIDAGQVRALVAGAVEHLNAERVEVVQVVAKTLAQPQPSYSRVGPIVVARESEGALRVLLGSLLALSLGTALLLVVTLRRLRHREPTLDHEQVL